MTEKVLRDPTGAGNSITAQFWDCAASSLDRSRKREFLEGAVTVILAYDISHKPSFDAILDSVSHTLIF